MKIGVTLKMYDYYSYAPMTVANIAGQARRAEELGFDSCWVMDHVFIQRQSGRVLTHDPMISLGAVAAATNRIRLGSLVMSHAFRHTAQLAREASALADASGGRFVLGLGTGWHHEEFDALGLPFDHRVSRLEEAVGPLRQLLRGHRATLDGKWLSLSDASIAVTCPPAPLWIAAEGPRMVGLAAQADTCVLGGRGPGAIWADALGPTQCARDCRASSGRGRDERIDSVRDRRLEGGPRGLQRAGGGRGAGRAYCGGGSGLLGGGSRPRDPVAVA